MSQETTAALSCALWGHHVDNHSLVEDSGAHRCRCGADYLARNGSLTRVRHTLSCFLGKHSYRRLADRDGCREYVCVQCGHPLVYPHDNNPYRNAEGFRKKVRYLCGVFGHRAGVVAKRDGFVEHACHCGHSFLKSEAHARRIRHPLMCVVLGHYVRYVTSRGGYDEFVCVNCGHPFFLLQQLLQQRSRCDNHHANGGAYAERRCSSK
jgi:hypothetical protein